MFITKEPICLEEFIALAPPEHCGGTTFFVGRVRNHHEGKKVKRLFYECYHSMAEKEIEKIVNNVISETAVSEIRVLHRVGWLEIGDIAVTVSASGVHRDEAFTACRQVIERIKQDVPIWKKEVYEDESQSWVVCTYDHHAIA